MKLLKILLLLIPLVVLAEEKEGLLNKLLAPGPLSRVHANLEGSCLKCHDAGKGVPDQQCLECHKPVAQFSLGKTGYHGLTNLACIKCHTEHKGRDLDSTHFDSTKFNHELTGFSLDGKHADIKCSECHLEKRTGKSFRAGEIRFMGKTNSCKSCHTKNDIHKFTGKFAAKECSTCHSTKSWKESIKFNHSTDTKYKLAGRHAELKCDSCHKNGKYTWPKLEQQKCLSCHDNVHKNNKSPKFQSGNCLACHNQTSWKSGSFDHATTGFALRGKHKDLQCTECHKQAVKGNAKKSVWTGLNKNCTTCHKDYHRYGNLKIKGMGALNSCNLCHNESSWKETHGFNHNRNTQFAITGKHSELKCNDCHIPKNKPVPKYHWAELNKKTCETCHKSPHVGQFSKKFQSKKCSECHTTEGWKQFPRNFKDKFDHSTARFPLTGAHTSINCSTCHVVKGQQVFRFPSETQKFCIDCHQNQHVGHFSQKFSAQSCATCHTTKTFTELKSFDHASTGFNLSGAHSNLTCIKCHTQTSEKFLGKKGRFKHKFEFPNLAKDSCLACHKDQHAGQLSKNCLDCHSDRNWKDMKFQHNLNSDFKIKGKHEQVKCQQCHKPKNGVVQYKPLPSNCAGCHKDVHQGQFGKNCSSCHTEKAWTYTRDFHRNFTLQGVHYSLSCNECHRDGRKLAGLSDQCMFCHQKDDVHSGTLPNCSECHKQQFWENSDFKHSMTRFPLRGSHRTLDCFQCHSNGIYTATPSRCVDCHARDALGATSLSHSLPAFNECQNCHNQFLFDR